MGDLQAGDAALGEGEGGDLMAEAHFSAQLEDPLLMSLRDELNSADLDNMTPMQAFDLLRNMKSQMKG